jgi:hypothetical protein
MERKNRLRAIREANWQRIARSADHIMLGALATMATVVPLVVASTGAADEVGTEVGAEVLSGDAHGVAHVRYGPEVPVGEGVARSYAVMNGGDVEEVGVALSEGALRGLPQVDEHAGHGSDKAPGGAPPGHVEFVLAMPGEHGTPYRFVGLDWNPVGHPPMGIYDAPHFDIHFYTIPEAERNLIDPSHPEFAARASRVPAMEAAPVGYLPHHVLEQAEPAALTVPRMGLHWVNPAGAEFAGGPFTAAMLYGSWDGEFVFVEPMVALDFLLQDPDLTMPLSRPPSGFAPGVFRVYRDAGTSEYRIALRDLETR